MLVVLLFGLASCRGVHSTSSAERIRRGSPSAEECVRRQLRLWAAARAWCVTTGRSYDSLVPVSNVVVYLREEGDATCPDGGRFELTSAREGPLCPNNHGIPTETRANVLFSLDGPRDKTDLYAFLKDHTADRRALGVAAIKFASSGGIITAGEATEAFRQAARDCDATVRLVAVEQMGGKDRWALSILVDLLRDRDSDVSSAAHRRLVETAGQDLGMDVARWTEWIQTSGGL